MAIAKKVLVNVKMAARAVVIMQKKTASAVTAKQEIAIVMSMWHKKEELTYLSTLLFLMCKY
ncbi:hypothetical protein [Gemella morbillorum]|uniref:hypothetical protein n=1 Tax=Gemella morbillorum TaxID=29391 RepID=UPI0028D275C8|nr:hypothetical protein [Gemella morbillorum]